MTVLFAQEIKKSYRMGGSEFWALKGVHFQIDEGEFVAIMGTSGSGKSTLLNILAGLDQPTSGEVVLNGTSLSGLSESQLTDLRRQQIGFIFQAFHLVPVLTALENVTLPYLLRNRGNRRLELQAKQMLDLMGLQDKYHSYPAELSGGQQQRVGIARALITKPKIILADEPTGSLDSNNSKELLHMMQQYCDEYQQSLVTVTHDPHVAAYAHRVLFLHDGELIDQIIFGKLHSSMFDRVQSIMRKMEELI